ncbi:MAG TPA: glycosyltransferase family 2 protein [Candidatus Sumerlaeota bacterium]|nr:glycosyltransferase family 2 protein [Candidatus Sumerlaeota bacterium]HOR28188.1 glycosyltransferase family 2 protein [Candidatus Sumerlaeota bacterium]HPK02089.1 glycosyltransferase family 2 protein [Candidatus Sumerlaeota bacterium]
MDAPPPLSVLVPCHNEEDSIAPTVDQLRQTLAETGAEFEIIVIDDGSTDRSAERVDPAKCRLIRLEHNRGYGAALKTGARAARHPWLAIIDADGTYQVGDLPRLMRERGDCAMVVGARRGRNARIPAARRPAKWILNQLANYLTGARIPDLNSGLRVIRRDLWERFEPLYPDGFSLTTTITLAALTNGYAVRHVPIEYRRRIGRSKIRPVRDTLSFVQLILRTVLYFDPLKVFVPLSLLLLLASIIVGLASKLSGEFMDVTTTALFVTGLQMLAIGALADLVTKRLP